MSRNCKLLETNSDSSSDEEDFMIESRNASRRKTRSKSKSRSRSRARAPAKKSKSKKSKSKKVVTSRKKKSVRKTTKKKKSAQQKRRKTTTRSVVVRSRTPSVPTRRRSTRIKYVYRPIYVPVRKQVSIPPQRRPLGALVRKGVQNLTVRKQAPPQQRPLGAMVRKGVQSLTARKAVTTASTPCKLKGPVGCAASSSQCRWNFADKHCVDR